MVGITECLINPGYLVSFVAYEAATVAPGILPGYISKIS
jgi:hypothetical protein